MDRRYRAHPGGILRLLLLAFLLGVLPWPRTARPDNDGIRYRVEFSGNVGASILDQMKAVSDAVQDRQRPPASTLLLRRRAEEDIPALRQVLKSHGYYAPEISIDIEADEGPLLLRFRIEPGPLYRIGSVSCEITDGDSIPLSLPSPEELGLETDSPARARPVIDARSRLREHVRARGHPFAEVRDRVVVDHATQTMAITFRIDPGPLIRLGAMKIDGLETVDARIVENRRTWTPGDTYDPLLLGRFRNRIAGTNLFSMVRVGFEDTTEASGRVPVAVRLRERDHQTIGLGGSYATDEGFGVKADWEHRNLLGGGERLRADVTVSEIVLLGGIEFRERDFLAVDQTFFFNLALAEDRTDVYTSNYYKAAVFFERNVVENVLAGAGITYRVVRVEQLDVERRYRLVSVPFRVSRDVRNDILDPTRGNRFDFEIAPYYDIRGSDTNFWKGDVSTAQYLGILDSPRLILAVRLGMGFTTGADTEEVPADERFYAGGGGSIRGYPYLTVSPLVGNDPVGGLSLAEMSSELRLKFTDSIGMVAFLDGGSAFESSFPDFDEQVFWGAGLGFRYFTGFGPLRVDVGFPLDRREGIDDSFEVYVGLGQAY